MFEFTYTELTPAQVDAYLNRIGYHGDRVCNKDTLDQLVYLHQCTVPFEKLDVTYKPTPIKLDADSLFDKIVTRHRGGFCFELNGAFMLLLRALGYDAYSCYCRVSAGRTEFSLLSHRATIVRMNGTRYVCDVGLGGPMASFAVEMSETRQSKNGETHWVEALDEGWYLQRRLTSTGEEGNVISFCLQPFLEKDFEPLCSNLLMNPRMNLAVNLRTATGHISIDDDLLIVEDGEGRHETRYAPEELETILKEKFGLVV